jgi:polyprenyl-phospho-N-acetylgalactosaminyl synthase
MDCVGDVVRSCRRFCTEVIVVDDGSTDSTSRVSTAAGAVVIRNEMNLGVVRSTEIGLRRASGDVIVTLDADGQHDPFEIPVIVRPIAQGIADLVLGKRCGARPASERIISRLCRLRVNCDDVGSGYRAFRKDLAHRIRLWGYCLCGSLVLEAQKEGARILEVPIDIKPRRYGRGHWDLPLSRGVTHCKQMIVLLQQLLG